VSDVDQLTFSSRPSQRVACGLGSIDGSLKNRSTVTILEKQIPSTMRPQSSAVKVQYSFAAYLLIVEHSFWFDEGASQIDLDRAGKAFESSGVRITLLEALSKAALALGQPRGSLATRLSKSILPMDANHHGSDESNAEPECRPDLKVEKQTFYDIVVEHLLPKPTNG